MHRVTRLRLSRPLPLPPRVGPSSLQYVARSSISTRHYSSDKTNSNGPSKDEIEDLADDAVKEGVIEEVSSLQSPQKEAAEGFEYPNLLAVDPLLDAHEALDFPPDKRNPYGAKVIIRNEPSMFRRGEAGKGGEEESRRSRGDSPIAHTPLTRADLANFHKYRLLTRRVTHQTGKGKIPRMYCLTVVGNGNGLVGYGEGKDDEVMGAMTKSYNQALRSMDWVERFEGRTLWTEMQSKMGSTRIILRPRPVGFGLRCNPNIHQILKAAGIKDVSAKVWGSRNPLNVIKCLFRMLQAGAAPLGMGDGFGGGGRKLDKVSGVRGKQEIEWERGRKLVDYRT